MRRAFATSLNSIPTPAGFPCRGKRVCGSRLSGGIQARQPEGKRRGCASAMRTGDVPGGNAAVQDSGGQLCITAKRAGGKGWISMQKCAIACGKCSAPCAIICGAAIRRSPSSTSAATRARLMKFACRSSGERPKSATICVRRRKMRREKTGSCTPHAADERRKRAAMRTCWTRFVFLF